MKLERILRREDGSRVRIVVTLVVDWFTKSPLWKIEMWRCGPRKRTWKRIIDEDDHFRRKLNAADKEADDNRRYLKFATRAEVLDILLELWLSIRPEFGKNVPVADYDLVERERRKI